MREDDVRELAESMGWHNNLLQNRWDEKTAGFRETLIAEVDGVPVGTVSFNEQLKFAGLLHLFAFDVAEPCRNRGIGTHLAGAIESAAKDLGLGGVYLEVNVENTDAIRFYERLGHKREGELFDNRWIAQDGSSRQVCERSQRMFKRFDT
jgi:ribosomal protein S18 acetylase RimI-like enzyme